MGQATVPELPEVQCLKYTIYLISVTLFAYCIHPARFECLKCCTFGSKMLITKMLITKMLITKQILKCVGILVVKHQNTGRGNNSVLQKLPILKVSMFAT